jgi:hypothetical protein
MSRYLGLAFPKNTTILSTMKNVSSNLLITLVGFLMGVFLTSFFAGVFLEEK